MPRTERPERPDMAGFCGLCPVCRGEIWVLEGAVHRGEADGSRYSPRSLDASHPQFAMRRTCPTCPLSPLFARTACSRLLPLLVGVLLAATGCTSTRQVLKHSDGYSRITEKVTGETVRVVLRDGRAMKLRNLYVGANSTRGTRPQGESKRLPTSELRKIEVVDHGTGFWQGAGLGLGTGLGSTLLLAVTQDSGLERDLAIIVGLAASVPMGLVGGIIGKIKGQKEVYRFPERSPKRNLTTAPSGRRTETVRRQEE